jgi:hypothetical protein
LAAVCLAAALCLPASWSSPAWAQGAGATTDITLTKTVEVYSYEDLTFTIDTYALRPGDNLAAVLKGRGLWPQKPDQQREAQILRLVGELNPVIPNLDRLSAGQVVYLPSARGLDQAGGRSAPLDTERETRDVLTYELGQPQQSPARVVVRRQVPAEAALAEGEYRLLPDGLAALPPPPEEGTDPAASPAAAAVPRAPAASGGAPPRFPGNEGPLSTAPDGTVYRTVKVRPGDTLERLMRREGLDHNLIYRHLLKLTVELNPGLRDPDVIVAGAELRIPADGNYLAGYGYETMTARTGGRQVASASSAPGGTAADSPPAPPSPSSGPAGGTPAPAAGERYAVPTGRLPSPALPAVDTINARSVIGIIFSRLGEKLVNKGRLFLPLPEPPHFDIDTGATPVLEITSGRKVVLDLAGSLPADLIKRLTETYREYAVFQPARREPMGKALERLFELSGYYRVYDKTQSFEGGRDVRLKITADWIVWPSPDNWNKGQPVVLNMAPSADNGTPPVWVKFLADHGIRVVDLYQGKIVGGSGKTPTPVNNFMVVEMDQNPSSFAAALLHSLGYSPRVGVAVDRSRGRVVTGGAEAAMTAMPPVFWETGRARNILEYGDLSTEDLQVLRKNGFNIISTPKNFEAVLKAVLASENLTLGGDLVLNGDSTGGPSIQLTVAGRSFVFNGRTYLFTPVSLPDNMTSLDPNQNVVVLHYRQSPAAVLPASGRGAGGGGTAAPGDVLSTPDGAGTISVETMD